jgi:glucose repression regulatory protein TUP1
MLTLTHKLRSVLNDLGHFAGDLYFRSLDFSPDASVVAAGAEDARIRVRSFSRTNLDERCSPGAAQIWNLTTRHMICTLDGHTQDIYSLRFSSHGRFLASGSGDGTVRIWDVPDQDTAYTWPKQQARVLTGPPDADGCVWSVAVSPNNQLVAGGSLDSTVRIWHAQTGALLHVITGHSNSVYSVVFTHDGCGLISGSQDKSLKYWDIRELAQLSPNAVMSRVRLLDVGRALRQIRKHHEPSSIDFLGHKVVACIRGS